MTDHSPEQCTLCSLLCAQLTSGNLPSIDSCLRWIQWIGSNQESHRIADYQSSVEQAAEKVHHLLSRANHALIWLEGADVLTTRAVVDLAKLHQAVIHVPTTIGQQHIRRVKTFDGWLGTTLAEMSEHSDVIITLGDQWIHRMPLLADRWISSGTSRTNRQWWHISSQESPDESRFSKQEPFSSEVTRCRRIVWPREAWYQRLTRLLQKIDESDDAASAASADGDLDNLAKVITESPNTTILWEASELNRPEDEVIVHRLFQLSQRLSTHSVCNLLALDSEVGHETARSTLMWLTGCPTTAWFDGERWSCPEYSNCFSLHDWQAAFDVHLFIRTAASLEPLPAMGSNVALCALPAIGDIELHHEIIPVATNGMETEAFLLRGDHGTTLYSDHWISNRQMNQECNVHNQESNFPSALVILRRALALAASGERSK